MSSGSSLGNYALFHYAGAIRIMMQSVPFLITLSRRDQGGKAMANIPCQLKGRASTWRANGSGTGLTYVGSRWLRHVANRSR